MCRRRRHTGKFCGKLCARPSRPSARFAVKFCRRLQSRAPPEADAARRSRGSGRRTQAPYLARRAMRAPHPGLSKGGNSRVRQLPCAAVAPFAACRGTAVDHDDGHDDGDDDVLEFGLGHTILFSFIKTAFLPAHKKIEAADNLLSAASIQATTSNW